MRLPITSSSYWLLLALVIVGIGACQRTSYSFQTSGSTLQPLLRSAASSISNPGKSEADLQLFASSHQASHLGFLHKVAVVQRLFTPVIKLQKQSPMASEKASAVAKVENQLATKHHPATETGPGRHRTKGIALLLAFFLGGFGAHLFYLGYYGRATAYLTATLAGLVLLSIAVVMGVAAIFGGGAGFVGWALAGTIVSGVVGVLALVDTIRIAIGDLKPKDGEYYARFFQTHDTSPQPAR
jgi:TM2 domain-containing membrane protein YozV